MPTLFNGARAPSTLGTFLRSFTHGHALQLHSAHRAFLARLAAHTPLLPSAAQASGPMPCGGPVGFGLPMHAFQTAGAWKPPAR